MSLASLGSRFSAAGLPLIVSDSATAVVAANAAMTALHVSANVVDTAANLSSYEPSLLSLGTTLTQVRIADTAAVTASSAASISGLAGLLTGPALLVQDTAANVEAALPALHNLGGHVSVTIVDSSANIGSIAGDLATLGSRVAVELTDTAPVTASVASALTPLAAYLVTGTQLAVTDTGINLATHAASLAAMGQALGAVTLSGGTGVTIANAASLAVIEPHLALGLTLTATGSVTDVVSNQAGLAILQADHRLASVIVNGATVADAFSNATLLNSLSAQVSVNDSATNVTAGLSGLLQISHLQTITLNDPGVPALTITLATLHADSTILEKITTPFTVNVSDSAGNIAADLAQGSHSTILSHLSQISQISASDGHDVALTQSQILAAHVDDSSTSALTLLSGRLLATDVDLAHLGQICTLPYAPQDIVVSDTAANIAGDLAAGAGSVLLSNIGSVRSITASSGGPVVLTAAQALYPGVDDSPHSVIGLLQGAQFAVTGTTIADLPQLAGLSASPISVAVSDTAASLSADLSSPTSQLVSNLSEVSTITVTDGGEITLTEQQLTTAHIDDGNGSVLSKVVAVEVAATQVSASDLTTILGLPVAPADIALTDNAGHIISNLATILADIQTISSISVTGGTLTLSAAEALAAHVDDGTGSLLDKVGGHAFVITGASVAQLPALLALPDLPASISISDSSSNIAADLTSGNSKIAACIATLGILNVTHGTLVLTDAQANQILADMTLNAVVNHLSAGSVVDINGVTVADLASLASSGLPHLQLALVDTPANIIADLLSPQSALLANAGLCTSVSLSAGGVIGAAALATISALPHFSTGGFALSVHDTAAALLALGSAPLSYATDVHVLDSQTAVASALDELQVKFSGALTVTLTDPSPAISITAATYSADQATIDAVTNPASFSVSDSAQAIASISTTIASDPAISTVYVTDTAASIIANISSLQSAGSKLHLALSDSSITANYIAPLLGIPTLNSAGLPIIDSGSEIASVVESGQPGVMAYLNQYGASLEADCTVSAADATALQSLTSFNKAGHTLIVWDTAQHLVGPAYTNVLSSPMIDGICLKASGNAATVTAAQAAALFAIPGFSTSNPSGTVNSLTVSDTAAHIEASLASLSAHGAQISGIIVNNSATVSDQILGDLQTLGTTAANAVSIIVHDTASAIAGNALVQSLSHGIQPAAWTLSANGVIGINAATVLGELANFSTGQYSLSLGLSSDTSISIADANKLGNIAGALALGGYHLFVAGSAAQLAALSPAALLVVTPALVDTIGNIAALPPGSPLLQGTIQVTGNDALDAHSAIAFLNVVEAANSHNVPINALTFDSSHVISDTVDNLRTLTSGSAWINSSSIHSVLNLSAKDTLGSLINPSNTSFLSGLSLSTLQSDATVNAHTASTLAALSSTIHFTRGVSQITVEDSATNLLDARNASGINLADQVTLAGPDHVNTIDAETLLNINHFHLNTSLVITDSSSNLLDGTLSSVISSSGFASHISVQLAGPEILDAQTAEAVVSIPGFSDAQNLTVSDDPSYLLEHANLLAEQMACQVTLAGDETVSANTVLRLTEIPHFAALTSHLVLAGNDFADEATLKAIADLGSAFRANGHTITMTASALDLTPTEYAALQSDHVNLNGHLLGISPAGVALAEVADTLSLSGNGVAGGLVRVYASDGSLISSNTHQTAGYTVTMSDFGHGQNFSATETTADRNVEGAPAVILDAGGLETAVAAAGGQFASSGALQVDAGKYIDVYQAGSVPVLTHPALVYDPSAHTVAFELPGQLPVTLVTLGGTTHPASLDASEIHFKTHG